MAEDVSIIFKVGGKQEEVILRHPQLTLGCLADGSASYLERLNALYRGIEGPMHPENEVFAEDLTNVVNVARETLSSLAFSSEEEPSTA